MVTLTTRRLNPECGVLTVRGTTLASDEGCAHAGVQFVGATMTIEAIARIHLRLEIDDVGDMGSS